MTFQQMSAWRSGWMLWLAVSVATVTTAAVLEYQPPRTIVIPLVGLRLPEMCSASRMFGIDCPGCGLTRSFVLAAEGRVATAFAIHPVGTVAFGLLVLQIPLRLWQGWRAFGGRSIPRTGPIEVAIAATLIAASFLWWFAKTIG